MALEGALASTMRLLLLRPGQLSADYLGGRRTRHIQPLRLYLTISILFFALMKMLTPAAPPDHARTPAPVPAVANAPPGTGPTFETWIRVHTPALAAKVDRFDRAPPAEKNAIIAAGFFKYGPYALFLTLPLLGLCLKLLYWRSRYYYGEHLVFSMHTNSFALIAIAGMVLIPSTLIMLALAVWLLAYLPISMHRTYGGGWIGTIVRAALLLGMQAAAGVAAMVAVAALTMVS